VTASSSTAHSREDSKGDAGIVRIYTLDPCAPCEIVKQAAKILAGDARRLGWTIEIVPTVGGDKKGMDKVLLAGVKHFPTVNLVRGDRVVKSYTSVREGWSGQDVAAFLLSEIEGQLAGPADGPPSSGAGLVL
jgi:hypothetical protein